MSCFVICDLFYFWLAYLSLIVHSKTRKTCFKRSLLLPLSFPLILVRNVIVFSLEKFARRERFEVDETEHKQAAELTHTEVKMLIRQLEKYET